MFLNHFDVLMSKIIFKNKKNIILIYFWVKKKLKNNHKHTPKYYMLGCAFCSNCIYFFSEVRLEDTGFLGWVRMAGFLFLD
jgi:hypothetical protein